MPEKAEGKFELWLGISSPVDGKFSWKVVNKYDEFDQAFKEYNKYVEKQLAYSAEDLKKIYKSGRLDIELRQSNKLWCWVGVYNRIVSELDKKTEKEEKAEEGKKEEKAEEASDK